MTAVARDVRALVLARAVRGHVEHRVHVNGVKPSCSDSPAVAR